MECDQAACGVVAVETRPSSPTIREGREADPSRRPSIADAVGSSTPSASRRLAESISACVSGCSESAKELRRRGQVHRQAYRQALKCKSDLRKASSLAATDPARRYFSERARGS